MPPYPASSCPSAKPRGQLLHLSGVQVVDLNRHSPAAQPGDQLGGFLDRLRAVVVGRHTAPAAAPPGADHRRARFPEPGGDPSSRTPGRAGNHRDPAPQCPVISRSDHRSSVAARDPLRRVRTHDRGGHIETHTDIDQQPVLTGRHQPIVLDVRQVGEQVSCAEMSCLTGQFEWSWQPFG